MMVKKMIEWLKKFARMILRDELTLITTKTSQRLVLINSLQKDIINYTSEIKALKNSLNSSKFKNVISTVKELYGEEDLKRTQSDKPSAHSSLDFEYAYLKIKAVFPEPNYRVFSVSNTNSMEPFIDQNSLIITEKIRYSVLKKQPLTIGDICIYDATIRGQYTRIIHRIIKVNKEKNLYYFLGDNNYGGDGWIPKQNIKYRYIGQIQTLRLKEND